MSTRGATGDAPPELAALFRPLRVGGLELANRAMMTALTLQYGQDGLFSDRHIAFYRARAAGGVGLIVSEQLTATPLSPSPFASALSAWDPRQVDALRRLTDTLRPYDAKFFVQLFAAGAAGVSTLGTTGWAPVRGASRIAAPGGEVPLPLSRDELAQIATDFARSAVHAVEAGADGIELHAAHGWLLGQFLSPYYNRREDEYGGCVEHYCRLVIEIGRAVRAAVGERVPVGLALSYDEFLGDAGITPEATLAQLRVFEATGLFDFYDLSVGSTHQQHFTIASMAVPEGVGLAFGRAAREVVRPEAAILIAGRVVDPAMAARAIATGQADAIGMARALLADPLLLRKSRTGARRDVVRCIGTNVCVRRALADQPVICVLNPTAGRELEWPAAPRALRPRRITVVGAGPAGLHFAATALAAGHRVDLFERDSRPGGHLALLAALPTRASWHTRIQDWVDAIETRGGRIHLGRAVSAEDLAADDADCIVIATGSRFDTSGRPRDSIHTMGVPGLDGARVLGLDDAIGRVTASGAGELGARVLIVDGSGSYAPLGLAHALLLAGGEVVFVTPDEQVGRIAAAELELPHLLPQLLDRGIEILQAYELEAVQSDIVTLRSSGAGPTRVVDRVETIVLCLNRLPCDELFRSLRNRRADVHCIGDACSPRSLEAILHEAEALARQLCA